MLFIYTPVYNTSFNKRVIVIVIVIVIHTPL